MERVYASLGRMRHSRKPKLAVLTKPAFPRYVLFSPACGETWQKAREIDGITLIMRRPGRPEEPGVLPAEAVVALRGAAGDGILIDHVSTIAAIERFAVGAGVKIRSGPFGGMPGTVVGDNGRSVRVLLSLLGAARPAAIPRHLVQVD
jgi:transcription antitermination factor NusG